MRSRFRRLAPLFCAFLTLAATTPFAEDAPAAPMHKMIRADQIVWGVGPSSLPPGGQIAVILGDPSQPAPFTIRAKLPARYRVAPHWHPGDENVTVLSGTVAMGMGEKFDEKALMALPVGGFAAMPANARHFFTTRTAAVIQVHGMGPFVVNYVNPADDPRNK